VSEHAAGVAVQLAAAPLPSLRLVAAALLAIAAIVLLIARWRTHPFLALTVGSFLVGALADGDLNAVALSYSKGFGDTVASVGVLIALGAMIGKLLADSGGADAIVEALIGRASVRMLPWAMAALGALIGLPLFFEIGLVLLMPVIYLVAERSGLPLLRVGIPALAGLSAMHGLVPPHPGPLVAVQALDADLGLTLALGTLVALPAVILAGPLFARVAARWVDVAAPTRAAAQGEAANAEPRPRPSFATTVVTMLLPVALMMTKALAEIVALADGPLRRTVGFLGKPMVALFLSLALAIVTLGRGAAMNHKAVAKSLDASLPPIAAILLIVAAGGGFKQTLIDSRVGEVAAQFVRDSGMSPLVLGWLVAVLIRLATGSATVATVTASGILAPIAPQLAALDRSLLVLSIGAGSIFFSHVNDAGFWLVKEYFGLSVSQNLKSWSIMETLLSVASLLLVLLWKLCL
jgi:GntP family gluconate:H+ symporter